MSKVKKEPKNDKTTEPTIEEIFTKLDHHKHILERPGMYVGSVQLDDKEMWVFDEQTNKIIRKTINMCPALYKIFDEILVNAIDRTVVANCKIIKVNLDKKKGEISIFNDGIGMPVVIHKEHNMYIPQLNMSELLTSTTYNQTKKIVGGTNGLGAKLTNIYSTEFHIETVDVLRKKKYCQKFENNMYTIDAPIITDAKKQDKDYTKITFIPDYKKFGLNGLTDDMYSLFLKRVYDIVACVKSGVSVYLNDKLLDVKSLQDYIKLYYADDVNTKLIYEEVNDRWTVGVIFDSNSGFRHISFVNGISTFKGGTHVNYILDKISTKLMETIKAKYKSINIKPGYIKDNLTLFINCNIEDPEFPAQTKEDMVTPVKLFGSVCELSDGFFKKLSQSGIIDEVVNFAQIKAESDLKKTDGKKNKSLRDIEKLDDANDADTKNSKFCRLILTEGDSAKSFALNGRSILGDDRIGVFPLRGKFLNVREATLTQLTTNVEFEYLKRILGLKQDKVYTLENISELRYGGIIILTDQDVDGSHIKGLIINMLHLYWPSLLKIKGFITTISTPIVKAWPASDKKRENCKTFYTMTDYHNWVEKEGKTGKWNFKYYKGLGTSTALEAKECFVDSENKIINFTWESEKEEVKVEEGEEDNKSKASSKRKTVRKIVKKKKDTKGVILEKSDKSIILAFDKDYADPRKNWLSKYDPNVIINKHYGDLPFSEFFDKDFIHFSNYDNIRSIPSLCDGLKPGQRKILYAAYKAKIENKEIKVAQFSGYVSQHTEYHHGEASLNGTIIKMAQTFVGSNNINYLLPSGEFGTRKMGGKDHASPRYIFTQLNYLTVNLFRKEDNAIYNYIVEEGKQIEPEYFAPILPTVLINGAAGIGTGYSTDIPCFNPLDIANNVLRMLDDKDVIDIHPWYSGFNGKITKVSDNKYISSGIYEVLDENNIKITELPIGVWTDDYKAFLYSLEIEDKKKNTDPKKIIEYVQSKCENDTIKFLITFPKDTLQKLIKDGIVEKTLKLTSSVNLSNMYLHNDKGAITKFDCVDDIFYDFYEVRLRMYEKRKQYMLEFIGNDLDILKYKVKFIKDYRDGKIVIVHRKEMEICYDLEKLGYPKLSVRGKKNDATEDIEEVEPEEAVEIKEIKEDNNKSYNYLINMSIKSLTLERINKLTSDYENKKKEFDYYNDNTCQQIWKNEVIEFIDKYNTWIKEVQERKLEEEQLGNKNIAKKKTNKKVKKEI